MLREESKQMSFYSSLYEKIPETHGTIRGMFYDCAEYLEK